MATRFRTSKRGRELKKKGVMWWNCLDTQNDPKKLIDQFHHRFGKYRASRAYHEFVMHVSAVLESI